MGIKENTAARGRGGGAGTMDVRIRAFEPGDVRGMIAVWNQVVEEGVAFPQEEPLTEESGALFFAGQRHCAVAEREADGAVLGLYILHPNNVGRCGHICNASYAVAAHARGMRVGEKLVRDCVTQAKAHGFRILQFNAVVATNTRARRLYERLGFVPLGVIPGGFRLKDGRYEDICPYYLPLVSDGDA
jgi:L-amino acid N-acyltransferase YncA